MKTITAEKARELNAFQTTVEDICKHIRKAAEEGEVGVNVSGELSSIVHNYLRDVLGFEVSYNVNNKATWIWWGSK